MSIADLVAAMEAIAPPRLAEGWDNVGLLLGDSGATLDGPALLTIDLREAVVREAIEMDASAVVAYHPPIFAPIRRLTADTDSGRGLLALARAGVAVYSPHTALDAAEGGVTDWLLGLVCPDAEEVRAIQPHNEVRPGEAFKIIVFIPTDPPELIDDVRSAMASAGAGRIGLYESCSFTVPGVGTFRAGEGANPAIGEVGTLEHVTELRLEMVCSAAALAPALAALRAVHPYEEPAFDVMKLEPRASLREGAGRIGTSPHAIKPSEMARALKAALGDGNPGGPVVVQVATKEDRPVRRVACVPGSGGSLGMDAAGLGAEVFVTGEMKHHEVLGLLSRGVSVIVAGHTETERGYLPRLAEKLKEQGIAGKVSAVDGAPLRGV
ncbi:MAG: Nif3-like dinuclear metal center hexameric protein [Phycisphaerales bacterium]